MIVFCARFYCLPTSPHLSFMAPDLRIKVREVHTVDPSQDCRQMYWMSEGGKCLSDAHVLCSYLTRMLLQYWKESRLPANVPARTYETAERNALTGEVSLANASDGRFSLHARVTAGSGISASLVRVSAA